MRLFGRKIFSLLLVALLVTGCQRIKTKITGQEVAPLVADKRDIDLLKARIKCDRVLSSNSDASKTRTCSEKLTSNTAQNRRARKSYSITVPNPTTETERNDVQELLLSIADEHFDRTKNHLIASQNSLTFSAEVTGVTLSAVSAILGDVETKTILSTTSALVQSTDTAIKKDFFANKTGSALINQMDATRATVAIDIIKGQNKLIAQYGFEAALRDAIRYDKAGLVHEALIALDTTAADAKQKK